MLLVENIAPSWASAIVNVSKEVPHNEVASVYRYQGRTSHTVPVHGHIISRLSCVPYAAFPVKSSDTSLTETISRPKNTQVVKALLALLSQLWQSNTA